MKIGTTTYQSIDPSEYDAEDDIVVYRRNGSIKGLSWYLVCLLYLLDSDDDHHASWTESGLRTGDD